MKAYSKYLTSGNPYEIPALKDACPFRVGATLAWNHLLDKNVLALVARQFSSITCENDMKPESLMDHAATLASGSNDRACFSLTRAEKYLDFAAAHGIAMRAHTLVWHNQTPRWFFAEGFSDAADAPLVRCEVMLARLQHYIADVMDAVNARWPGVVYAWDVVNEAIEPDNGHERGFRMRKSLWYQTMGERFVEDAFTEARKHCAPGQKLFYNDYLSFLPEKQGHILNMLRGLTDKGLVDGMGMQMHIHPDLPEQSLFEEAARKYAALGLTIHLTELDVNGADATPEKQMMLAKRYKQVAESAAKLRHEGIDLASITIWGLNDGHSWLTRGENHVYPMLFDAMNRPKPAFFGLLCDEDIPAAYGVSSPEKPVKLPGDHNPVMVHDFGADPWALVYKDRVYLYMTGDHYVYDDQGKMTFNHYGDINTIHVISSADLVNWVDHGQIQAAGEQGAAKWARNSWAPAAAWKTIDGKDRFFLYFADSGNGIGVLSADSPVGPFTDPLGGPIVSRHTPTCDRVTWLFDPAVLLDEDGTGWLYCGGGVPEGKAPDPGTARVVRLNDDMISLAETPTEIAPPFLFEDSGINRFGDKYVYSYCSNFSAHEYPDNEYGIVNGEIQTMVADSPKGPFTYRGAVLRNPEAHFGVGGNNHHCMFKFGGEWYIAYHAQSLEKKLHTGGGYRNTHIDRLILDESGLPVMSEGTWTGVMQRRIVDAHDRIPGAMTSNGAGIGMRPEGDHQALCALVPGAWSMLEGVDFGAGMGGVMVRFRSQSAVKIEIRLDDLDNEPATVLTLPAGFGMRELLNAFDAPIAGKHDVFFVFSDGGAQVDWWQFHDTQEVVRGDNPITAMDFPDPDVIRVDDTYYMVSTTMHMMPGCVILQSYDLINWEYCTRVYDVLDDTPGQRLENSAIYGKGMWAATLRWHKGTFYIIFVANDTHKTYLFRTEDIHGPWRRSEIEGFYHDCSLLFDDDERVYLAYGHRQIHLTELDAELTGPKAGGIDRIIADYGEGDQLGYEGSHLYKRNGKYYLFMIHSLKDRWRRVESCFIADSIEGEFRGGVVFNDDMGVRDDGIAQGGIVDTPDGRWFAILFQDTGAAGRIPVLLPMTWERDWPVIGLNGKAPKTVANLTTRPGYEYAPLYGSDCFDGPLNPAWEWNHIPRPELVQFGGGELRITTGKTTPLLTGAQNTLTQRAILPACEAEVTLDASRLNNGDTAGLCVLQSRWGLIGLRRENDQYRLVVCLRGEEDERDGCRNASIPWNGPTVRLKATMCFSAQKDTATFAYWQDGEWIELGGEHELLFLLDHFMGNRFGLSVFSEERTGGTAAFSDFVYRHLGE